MMIAASSLAKTGGRSQMKKLRLSELRMARNSAVARSLASNSAECTGPAIARDDDQLLPLRA